MNSSTLLDILADGDFHSGQDLGVRLAVSRTAVWKQIRKLRATGLQIQSVTGKGYRLSSRQGLLRRERILAKLPPELANSLQIELALSIDSTNAEAMRHVQNGLRGPALFVAEQQSAGKGRRGRQWLSPMASNIYMSLVWPFDGSVSTLEGLSLITALAVVDALERNGCNGISVKWPNDVLLGGKKLAGILLELHGDMEGPLQVIVGVGLNVSMPPDQLESLERPATDLVSHFSATFDRNLLLADLVEALFSRLNLFQARGFGAFRKEWEALDSHLGRWVNIESGKNTTTGRVLGVDDSGALRLQTSDGELVIRGGEVQTSLRPVNDASDPVENDNDS
ncbi:MAG: bifunctional biotin--[acetyl-CoA-carboxylase] ligase/biotin operon repressor BirA [Pseudohongiellaceae bacterium]